MTDLTAKKKPDEWLNTDHFKGQVIYDPDGWDRTDFATSWEEPIDLLEMTRRMNLSTVMMMPT